MQQIIGVVLIIVGVAYFAFQGFSVTSREKVLDIGPIEATAEKEKQVIPYAPIVGAVIVAGGAILLLLGAKNKN